MRCTQDKQFPVLYSFANNMAPGLVPPELQVSVYHCLILCSLIMSFQPSFVTGIGTGGRDVDCSCDANHVHIPVTAGTVWLL